MCEAIGTSRAGQGAVQEATLVHICQAKVQAVGGMQSRITRQETPSSSANTQMNRAGRYLFCQGTPTDDQQSKAHNGWARSIQSGSLRREPCLIERGPVGINHLMRITGTPGALACFSPINGPRRTTGNESEGTKGQRGEQGPLCPGRFLDRCGVAHPVDGPRPDQ